MSTPATQARKQVQSHAIHEENERREREGYRIRRDVVWYPNESTAQPCRPGGQFVAQFNYDSGAMTYTADGKPSGSTPPSTSAWEMINAAELSANYGIDLGLLVGGIRAGLIEGETKGGVRRFYYSVTEARGQAESNTNVLAQLQDLVEGVTQEAGKIVTFLFEALSSGFTLGGVSDVIVPSESVGHIRTYQERKGWFKEGSDQNGSYVWTWGHNFIWTHVYTLNYAEYLTGKSRWEGFLSMDREERLRIIEHYQNFDSRPNAYRINQPMWHPWIIWARAHNYPVTAPPPDVRRLNNYARAEHNYHY